MECKLARKGRGPPLAALLRRTRFLNQLQQGRLVDAVGAEATAVMMARTVAAASVVALLWVLLWLLLRRLPRLLLRLLLLQAA